MCMGVGDYEVGEFDDTPLAETWNGSSWSVSNATDGGSIGGSTHNLWDVSCPVAKWCAAVGGGNGSGAFAETWNGTKWTEYTISAPLGSQSFALQGISCTSTNQCIAVGNYTDSTGYEKALTENWNGATWTEGNAVAFIPSPQSDANSELDAISCASPSSCVAVGNYEDEPEDTWPALAESWNGSKWTVDPTPIIPNAYSTGLDSVSCWAPESCIATGRDTISGNPPPEGNTVSESRDGSSWHLQTAPVLPELFSGLGGVSCASATFCAGIGNGSAKASYIALWNGTWSDEAFGTTLEGVSCVSEAYCVAVGSPNAAVYAES
jgi:hypothetical protein